MQFMFNSARAFNQALVFDTSSVTDMGGMFQSAVKFNQDISGWDISQASLTNMNSMFNDARELNQPFATWPKWDVTNKTNKSDMFSEISGNKYNTISIPNNNNTSLPTGYP